MNRIFLLSPARCSGKRADLVFNDGAAFPLASRLRSRDGAPLGEVFAFLSGLYFRGKLAYANAFARPPRRVPGALVITSDRGLLSPETPVTLEELRAFASVDLDAANPLYRQPLLRDARALCDTVGERCEIVLLGSVATGKYFDLLLEVMKDRLRFPPAFVGRGDMSRGGLMLRAAAAGIELDYVPAGSDVKRHGPRPPKLPR